MTSREGEQLGLVAGVIDGLKQKPAYLLLFGILVVFMVVVSSFAWTASSDLIIVGSFVVFLVAFALAANIIKIVELSGRIPAEQRQVMEQLLALGTKEDIPLTDEKVKRWAERWNCEWSYLSESGRLLPYVNDNITIDIDRVDRETGLARARSESPYRGGATYDIWGRISKRDMGLMFYSFQGDLEALQGVIILRLRAAGTVHGWWLGIGKKNVDIGGQFTWTESKADPEFRAESFNTREDPPKR